ncbi:2-C-methyl-D-erythritol 4-phosphate cytidylyltransferase [Balneolaceae bacterium YR4-1]|uniref:2-C-methyl-D-erythritol 4-phosphate cytidylyltransferase n=1 Tax=Halalkalibaculum roseum TaxID=2709311 RepID=A0A6M1T5T7_9BACT|nr:2-C-methyl-D-erythritol 4-phosphate cytidylyltransferase [Halalkalibaculum roseum]NGP78137.1 2-C-methyl-D-erythritol 4-phosphate cytidylyltransferase [Halalkalibaculum roseum]
MTKATLIIPAAGSGSRLNRETPKPFLEISGKTILEHTILRFLGLESLGQVVVATSPLYLNKAEEILNSVLPEHILFHVIEGGAERQHSIFNTLKFVDDGNLAIVHDAVRPFVELKHIENCCKAAMQTGASVLGVPAKDTIKKIDKDQMILDTPSRSFLWQAQTPQVFKKEILQEAYQKAFEENFIGTDDASLVERLGHPVKMVEGDRSNFKITYPLDLKLAKLLLSS